MPKCRLSIELDGDRTYAPGEPITGSVMVRVLRRCRCENLNLSWRWTTQGSGRLNEGPSKTLVTLSTQQEWLPGQVLRYPFRLESPTSPLSLHENVLRVDWLLRAEAHLSGRLDTPALAEERFALVTAETSRPAAATTIGPGSPWKLDMEGGAPWLQVAEPREVKRSGPAPSVDARRKLEGGIEVLEAAHTHYAALEKALQQRKWKLHLRPRLDTLRETIRQEPALVEALDRLHHRARAEGWTETEPALALAREVETLRARVGALVSSRLGTPGDLEQLEQSVVQSLPAPLAPEEKLLLMGGFSPSLAGQGLLLLGVGFTRCAGASGPPVSWGWLWLAWMVLSAGWLLSQYRRSGRFWLTEERLIWLPTRGDPLQLPLRDLQPEGTRECYPKGLKVRLMNGNTVHLAFISQAGRLAAGLERQRRLNQPPVR